MRLKDNDILHYALRNRKLRIGLAIIAFFMLVMLAGPLFARWEARERAGLYPSAPPNSTNWMGTTKMKEDIFSQFIFGTQSTFLIGFLAGCIGTTIGLSIGFFAGYVGGWFDELLMMLTNILLVIPSIALLIILAAYLPYRGVQIQSVIIGCTAWPWVARAVRSQTLSLKQRGFVSLARISGVSPLRIIFEDIAPNMLSYVVMVFILQFGGAILYAVALDFIGLGPTRGISLGLMMQEAFQNNALQVGYWWWFIPSGLSITLIVSGLFFLNTGLDEVFNPKLRDQ
ncbi:MAG: ABC transporter permease [Spirochaetes bacterium]|nr:ABC transporter permease [Spirochaetota bacterium]MBU0956564.1 ABC transporter permease [Spirochaetota bacterium]